LLRQEGNTSNQPASAQPAGLETRHKRQRAVSAALQAHAALTASAGRGAVRDPAQIKR